jgi:hypothetical protein
MVVVSGYSCSAGGCGRDGGVKLTTLLGMPLFSMVMCLKCSDRPPSLNITLHNSRSL